MGRGGIVGGLAGSTPHQIFFVAQSIIGAESTILGANLSY
jgi:hypothetical protein